MSEDAMGRTEASTDKIVARRIVAAAAVGNALEWYDFTVYALLAIYIAKAFFPGADPTAGLVKAFIAFGLGFVVRPVGALILGIYADRAGRKAALSAAIWLMAAGVAVIAFAPDYAAIGVGAPLLLLLGRTLQGLSAGGEYGAAAAMLVEHAPERRKGEFASWLQAAMAASNILGALVAFAVTSTLTPSQVAGFGWRLPFLAGLLIAPVGLWIRAAVAETPQFQARALRPTRLKTQPLRILWTEHRAALLKGWSLCILQTVSSYALVIFMPTYVQRTLHHSPAEAFAASLVGNALMTVACVLGGVASDRFGKRTVLVGAAIWLGVLVLPMLWLMRTVPGWPVLATAQTVLCLGAGTFLGVAPSAVAELFPTEVRSTGVALAYNLAVVIFSGFAPAILAWLTGRGGAYAPGWYELIAIALAAPALLALKASSGPAGQAVASSGA
jgi:MHS family proline/betaine transporter-like MFS transporter